MSAKSLTRQCGETIAREQERSCRLRVEAEREDLTLRNYRKEEKELLREKEVQQERGTSLRVQISEMENQLRGKEDKIEELKKSIVDMR